MGFTLVFATELLVNLIATWPREFLNDPWNHFDTFTVSISVCTLVLPPSVLPPEGSDTLKVWYIELHSHILAAYTAALTPFTLLCLSLPATKKPTSTHTGSLSAQSHHPWHCCVW